LKDKLGRNCSLKIIKNETKHIFYTNKNWDKWGLSRFIFGEEDLDGDIFIIFLFLIEK